MASDEHPRVTPSIRRSSILCDSDYLPRPPLCVECILAQTVVRLRSDSIQRPGLSHHRTTRSTGEHHQLAGPDVHLQVKTVIILSKSYQSYSRWMKP